MNYRHGYHAGNFADVFKHIVLIALIQALSRKDKPFCYLETHAGSGQYDLRSEFSQKTLEYTNGIEKIMTSSVAERPMLVQTYCDVVSTFQYPSYYPGSPAIAESLLRKTDRMNLMEFHPEEFFGLKRIFKNNKRIDLHFQDGYTGLNAFLPPIERRGLILIDPPFERPNEWRQMIKALQISLKKFSSGVYALWYPLKDQSIVEKFLSDIKALNLPEYMITEFSVYPPDASLGLIGCGMVVINPPWKLEEELRPVLAWVWKVLSVNGAGQYKYQSYGDLQR